MERPTSAPPVVAVIVATEPGPWFEEALRSMGSQDYPNLSVLVVDACRNGDPTARVAAVLPDAYVRKVDGHAGGAAKPGFASIANVALETVEGAAFLVFCHDDVAPDGDAIRRMVEEAMRSNAAIVAPKIVEWDRPERLLDVGLAVDKAGATAAVVDRGELDQEQHDAVRDVFAVSDTCMLVRGDIFDALGGFDPVMGDHGADVDFCWRAQVVGGRVLVAPAARVRHAEAGDERPGVDPDKALLERRHHLRAILKSYSALHLARVLPQAVLITTVEVVVALGSRRWADARAMVSAWAWNLRPGHHLRRLRKATQKARAVPDSDVRRLQVRGSVRLTNYLQRRLHAEDKAQALVSAGHRLAGSFGSRPGQVAATVFAILFLAILVGFRHLITGSVPAVGELAPFPRAPTFLTHYFSGWRVTGLGSSAPAPTLFAFLGASGVLLLGKMALLQKILILAAWPVALLGIWHFSRPLRSTLARLVAVIVYLAVPLPYNALAGGRLGGVLTWAAFPWIATILVRLSGLAPFGLHGDDALNDDDANLSASRRRLDVLKLAVLLAVVGAWVPSIAVAVLVAAAAIAVGSLLVGGAAGSARILVGAAAAVGIAVILHLPWSADLFLPGGSSTIAGVAPHPAAAFGFGSLLRFQVGPMGAAPLSWALLVAAALPLAMGAGWRLAWAARLWLVTLVCVLVAWAGGRGWIPLALEAPDVLLAPAALGLAFAAALGANAFEVDLPGYRFGWRQVASLVAGCAVALSVLPVLSGMRNGRWGLTTSDVTQAVAWMPPLASEGAFRVLWLGDTQFLPLDGWRLDEGIAYATSRDGPPQATDLLPGRPSEATKQIAAAIRLARDGDTARIGRLLAPMAIRYIVVPSSLVTGPDATPPTAVNSLLTRALVSQLDLRLLPSDQGLAVYENTAWGPGRAVSVGRAPHEPFPAALGAGGDLSGSTPVLPGTGPIRFEGEIPEPGPVLLAESPSSRWDLTVNGNGQPQAPAYGVANAFAVTERGPARMQFRTPLLRYGAIAVQVLLWALAVRAMVGLRRRAVEIDGMARSRVTG